MEVEFKEKTYEKYFSHEIARLTNVTFSPDPVDEALLGFDDAFWLPLRWMRLRTPFFRRGSWTRMSGMEIREIEHISEQFGRRMPPFRFNLFVQYKRPVFLKSRGAGEWEHWGCPYYRYSTTPHQQDLLEKIEAQSLGRAAVVYASPAFWRSDDLWNNAQAQTIIDNSNIASAGRLKSHGRYSYASAGFQGKGHSEATSIESPVFKAELARGLEQPEFPFNSHIRQIAKVVLEAVRSGGDRGQIFQSAYAAMNIGGLDAGSVASALLTIQLFADIFETSYLAVG